MGESMVRLRVKELAEERGISLSKLSRIADVSYKVVQRMYREPQEGFNSKSLERVAAALHVSIGELFEDVRDE
jgi:DNA-binding Xre family transcriptional regulator